MAPRGGKPARRGFHLRAPLFGSGTTPAPAANPNAPSGEGSTVPPMALVPRNAPCPCGSGLKYKRCCLDRERELARRADALEVLGGLAALFPLMRPCGGELEEWLAAHATPDPDPETIDAGIALLSPAERRAIVDAHRTQYPGVWQSLVDDAGGVETAEESAVIGALAAALRETRTPDHLAIQLLGDEDDPAEQLALAIDATNLWSIQEAAALDEVLASLDSDLDDDLYERVWIATIEHIAARFWTDAHERRLDVLVGRLRSQLRELPPSAGEMLGRACGAYENDQAIRQRLGALLLSDTLGPLLRLNLALPAAA